MTSSGGDPCRATPVDEQSEPQLALLARLAILLSSRRIRFWLRGGWGIDFLLGQITRTHADLDLVIWVRHRNRARQTLLGNDFVLTTETEAQSDFRKGEHAISFVFLERDPNGDMVTHGIPGWTWRSDALSPRRRALHGVSARVLSPQQLLDEKAGYERGTGRSPRPKDLESMAILRRLIVAETDAVRLDR